MKPCCLILSALACMASVAAEPAWFAPDAASKQALETALAAAQKSNHRLLVMYDGSWCTLCAEAHDAAAADADVPGLVRAGYEFVHVTTDDSAGLAKFASAALDVDLKKDSRLLLSVLESDGSPRVAWTARRLTENGRFSVTKLKAQLAEFTLGAPAEEVYRSGLAALPEGKIAWVEFRADWCGWCKRMEQLFGQTDVSPVLARYYKIVTIDTEKNQGAGELAKSLGAPHGVEGGIPWFALVDAKGKPIVTSEGPKGNIGFPGTKEELAHFRTMLKTTAPGITGKELDTIFDALQALTPKPAAHHS